MLLYSVKPTTQQQKRVLQSVKSVRSFCDYSREII